MLYLLIGMGICISLFIIAFAFARAAAHADEHHDFFVDQKHTLGTNELPSAPAHEPTIVAPQVAIEAGNERVSRTRERTDVIF